MTPAAGYTLLLGATLDGNELPISSFLYFAAGDSISDPDLGVYEGTLQWFNLMEGFLPRPSYPTQEPFIDPTTGLATKFALWGDPVAGTGWIDGIDLPPSDRRLLMTVGPFSMSLGDTQEVIIALTGATGIDYLDSITELKQSVQQIRSDFLTGIEFDESDELPQSFSLSQNYPNPFNPSTTFEFTLPQNSNATFVIYDILGRRVNGLLDGKLFEAGRHTLRWNGKNEAGIPVSSGLYIYRIDIKASDKSGNLFTRTRKMVLLR